MSDGTLWKIVGDKVTPRPLNTNIFGTARSLPAPQTMVSTPEGGFVLILAGNGTAFLYSSADDDFVAARSVIPTPIAGYYGPIAAGPERPILSGERPGAEPGADAHRLYRHRSRRRRRIARSGRPVVQRTAGRRGGRGRRVELTRASVFQ